MHTLHITFTNCLLASRGRLHSIDTSTYAFFQKGERKKSETPQLYSLLEEKLLHPCLEFTLPFTKALLEAKHQTSSLSSIQTTLGKLVRRLFWTPGVNIKGHSKSTIIACVCSCIQYIIIFVFY